MQNQDVKKPDITTRILALLEKKPYIAQVHLVYMKENSGDWKFLMGKCEISQQGSYKKSNQIYPNFAFFSFGFSSGEIIDFIDEINGEGHDFHDGFLPLKRQDETNHYSETLAPSYNNERKLPKRTWKVVVESDNRYQAGMLLAYGMEFFPSSSDYIKDFMELRVFHENSHSDLGGFLISIYDSRGVIEVKDDSFVVRGTYKDGCLSGVLSSGKQVMIKNGEEYQATPKELVGAELWLITKENEVLDYITAKYLVCPPYGDFTPKTDDKSEKLIKLSENG